MSTVESDVTGTSVSARLVKFINSKQGQRIVGNQAVFLPLRGFQSAASAEQLSTLPRSAQLGAV